MKIKIFVTLFTGFVTICADVAAGTAVNVTVLERIAPTNTYFTAKAESMEVTKLAFPTDRGVISETAKVGQIVAPSVYNADGSTAEQGSTVGVVVNDRQVASYDVALMKEKIDEEVRKQALMETERDKKMLRAVSRKQTEDDMIALNQAKLQVELDKATLLNLKADLEGTKVIAPFSGIITKETRGPGMGIGGAGDDFIEITRMSPIVIKMQFPSEIVNQILSQDKIVSVYPPELNKSIPAWLGINNMDNDVLLAYILNDVTIDTTNLTSEQQKMLKAYVLFPILPFYETDYFSKLNIVKGHAFRKQYDENLLSVPDYAVHNDDKGSYVLRAAGQKAINLEKGISREFTVEKVYVKVGKLKDRNFGAHTLVSLDDPGSLKLYDIIILAGDINIKDADKVVFCRPMWLVRPGDNVKLSIPSITKPGFYVPVSAIIHESEGYNYVYIVADNKAKLVRVNLVGTTGDYYSIQGLGIDAGTKVVVVDDKKQVMELYDGMDVEIKNIIPASARLQRPHANQLSVQDNPTFFN